MKIALAVITVILLGLLLAGCSNGPSEPNEPPLKTDKADENGVTRAAKLLDVKDGCATYVVVYPGYGLTSEVTIDLPDRTMSKEVFAGKWVLFYKYADTMAKFNKMPSTITIHSDQGNGDPGPIISDYKFKDFVSGKGAMFIDQNGKERIVEIHYFDGISGG